MDGSMNPTAEAIYERLTPFYDELLLHPNNATRPRSVLLSVAVQDFISVYFSDYTMASAALTWLQLAAEAPEIAGYIMEDLPPEALASNRPFIEAIQELYKRIL